jgi:Co/Zn/Cd efflux system component
MESWVPLENHCHNPRKNKVNDHHSSVVAPSNEKILCTAFVSFQCFAIAQTIAAVIAGSEALLGDSFAMLVDALTYLVNWLAERQKAKYRHQLHLQQQKQQSSWTTKDDYSIYTSSPYSSLSSLHALKYKQYTYQMELVPPLLSVSILIVVTVVVLKESIQVLLLDAKRDISEQSDPNVHLMMVFSFLNLLLDVVNVGCFASAKHAMGYNTHPVDEEMKQISEENRPWSGDRRYSNEKIDDCEIEMVDQTQQSPIERLETTSLQTSVGQTAFTGDDHRSNPSGTYDGANHHCSDDNRSCEKEDDAEEWRKEEQEDNDLDEMDETSPMRPSSIFGNRRRASSLDDSLELNDDVEEEASNLNMCSAYTHIFADTLRSLAVILASLLAQFTSTITSEVADATAAVVVSLLIMLSLLPLFGGMVQTFRSLQRISGQIEAELRRESKHHDNHGSKGESTTALLQFV